MKIAHSVKITVFVKEEENADEVKASLLELVSLDLEKDKIELKEEEAKGFDEKKIKILEVVLEKDKHIEAFFKGLVERMSDETKKRIQDQAKSRTDGGGNFFLRFSKEKWIKEKDFWLTDQGNCFHIKINVAAFPKKRKIVEGIIRNVFKVGEQN